MDKSGANRMPLPSRPVLKHYLDPGMILVLQNHFSGSITGIALDNDDLNVQTIDFFQKQQFDNLVERPGFIENRHDDGKFSHWCRFLPTRNGHQSSGVPVVRWIRLNQHPIEVRYEKQVLQGIEVEVKKTPLLEFGPVRHRPGEPVIQYGKRDQQDPFGLQQLVYDTQQMSWIP